MKPHGLALGTAFAVTVGHSAHPSQYHLLVDSVLGVGAGVLLVVAYLLVLRWYSGRDGDGEGSRDARQRADEGSDSG